MEFAGSHILSVSQFERADVERIFQVADGMDAYARRRKRNRVLDGAILGNMFFEASTRTRVSFGCAFNLLGGSVRETTGFEHSAMAKGESLYDMARVLSGYIDVVVLRHPEEGSAQAFADASRAPVINGGDGSNEHPTQALLDLYTITRELRGRRQDMDGLRIALVGDLRYGRTVHSLCRLLCLYRNVTLKLISPQALQLPEEEFERLQSAGHDAVCTENMEEHIADVDIIYATRIQEERFAHPEEALQYRRLYHLDESVYTRHCRPNTVIMHPLPRDARGAELDTDLNEHSNLAIFRQTDNGVLIRMALFALLFDVTEQLPKHDIPMHWHSRRRE